MIFKFFLKKFLLIFFFLKIYEIFTKFAKFLLSFAFFYNISNEFNENITNFVGIFDEFNNFLAVFTKFLAILIKILVILTTFMILFDHFWEFFWEFPTILRNLNYFHNISDNFHRILFLDLWLEGQGAQINKWWTNKHKISLFLERAVSPKLLPRFVSIIPQCEGARMKGTCAKTIDLIFHTLRVAHQKH